ncbi:DUF4230 domain-containing protein [Spirulina sp. CS-785/01]|uniref:DUF4230 domain-containing protein n=1 Tax=Spirulina sp. CS-785/01 TaxID=3021716 RepID=UPI00232AC204|nr:DUF4230 domain-containing protein [Spirulina sp. CS-785/01]MDB9312822.1 DUF4230 domain-containing protein [Spirulina sp. CS-785/01]
MTSELKNRTSSDSPPVTPPSPSPKNPVWQVAKGGIGILLFLFLLNLWVSTATLLNGVRNLFSFGLSEPQADISTLIVEKIRTASDLTTAVYSMETVVPTQQNSNFGPFTFPSKMLYIGYGEVEAGIDLSAITQANVQVSDQQITVQLPPPEILDSKIDVNRSKVYDYDEGFLNLGPNVAHDLQSLAQQKTLEKLVTAACEKNILLEANNRAELAITQLLDLTGHENITVKTSYPSPASCKNNQSKTAKL